MEPDTPTRWLGKVTAFILRPGPAGGEELLLFEHPHAGIQLPAGTVEPGEDPQAAALREATEESGLAGLTVRSALGVEETLLPEGQAVIAASAPVYRRPEPSRHPFYQFRPGTQVRVERREAAFVQVTFEESDRYPDPRYITYQITGWVDREALGTGLRRHFYRLDCPPGSGWRDRRWVVEEEHHRWTLFWAPLAALPEIVWPQSEWLRFLDGTYRGG